MIYAQREGFGDEKEKQKEAEEEAAMKRMQVESSEESGLASSTGGAFEVEVMVMIRRPRR